MIKYDTKIPVDIHNIVRFKNDTYPITGDIEIDGNYIDISDDWEVIMYYRENGIDNNPDKEIIINGKIVNGKNGKFAIYPNVAYCKDITDQAHPIQYTPFAVPGEYDYSIIRRKIYYREDTNGDYVYENDAYRAYNAGSDGGMTRYNKLEEKATHAVGKLVISDRVGL